MIQNTVYTVREVANILQVSTKTMYAIIKSKDIDAISVRGQIRITSTALQTFLQGDANNER